MKKILIIAAAAIALIFSIWGFFRMRSETVSQKTDILVSIPENPCAVLRINKAVELSQNLLYNNNYWRSISSIEGLSGIHGILSEMDSLKDVSTEIRSIMENRNFLIGVYMDDSLKTSSIAGSQISATEYGGISGYLKSKGLDKNCRYEKDVFLYSDNQDLLERAVKQVRKNDSPIEKDSVFMKIYRTAGYNVAANLFVNMGKAGKVVSAWGKQGQRMEMVPSTATSWSGFDVEFSEDKMVVSGFGDNSITNDIGHVFEGQNAGHNELVKVLPYNTVFFYHYSLSDFEKFRDRLSEFRAARGADSIFSRTQAAFESPTGETPLLFFQEHFGGEIALGMNYMGEYVIVKLNNPMAASERLKRYHDEMEDKIKVTSKDGVDIYELPSQGFAGGIFGSTFTLEKEYAAISGNSLIIAESPKLTVYVASRNPNTQTLQCSPTYKQANLTLLSSSNLSVYADIPYMVRNASQFINEKKIPLIDRHKDILGNFESLGIQEEAGNDELNYRQVFLQYNPKIKVENPVRRPIAAAADSSETRTDDKRREMGNEAELLFSLQLDAPARTKAMPVTNHYTGETEFAVQDKDNRLYLVNSKGKILWKIQLTGAILGEITQVDMLKNKKLQMAFVTADKFYIIDRNGNNLKGFPKSLKSKAADGLSVFDYDNDLNYRFFYPASDNSIVLLRGDGSTPSDWTTPKMKGAASQPVQYFRINNRDYLLAADASNCYFYDRKGNKRLIPERNPAKSELNGFFVDESYDNKRFVYSTPEGGLCFVEQNNKVNSVRLEGRDAKHKFATWCMDKEIRYSFFDSKGLTIYDKDFNLLMEESHIQASPIPIFDQDGGLIALYDEKGERCLVYDMINAAQTAKVPTDADFITICDIKPYKKTAVAVCAGRNLKVYGF